MHEPSFVIASSSLQDFFDKRTCFPSILQAFSKECRRKQPPITHQALRITPKKIAAGNCLLLFLTMDVLVCFILIHHLRNDTIVLK